MAKGLGEWMSSTAFRLCLGAVLCIVMLRLIYVDVHAITSSTTDGVESFETRRSELEHEHWAVEEIPATRKRIALVAANVNFCNIGGGVLWVAATARMLVETYPDVAIHILISKCRCINLFHSSALRRVFDHHPRIVLLSPCSAVAGSARQEMFDEVMDAPVRLGREVFSEWNVTTSAFRRALETEWRNSDTTGLAPDHLEYKDVQLYMMALKKSHRYDLWIVRGENGLRVSTTSEFRQGQEAPVWYVRTMTVGRNNRTFDMDMQENGLGRNHNRVVLSNPFLSSEQLAELRLESTKDLVFLPPMVATQATTTPRKRKGTTVCHIGAIYAGANQVDDLTRGFLMFKEQVPSARFLFIVSEVYLRTGGAREDKARAHSIISQLNWTASHEASGIDLHVTTIDHERALELYLKECDVGVRVYTAKDAPTTFSTKMLEMSSTGLPLLMNRLPVNNHYWGDEYPFYFDSARSFATALTLALAGDPAVYTAASRIALRWSSEFTFGAVGTALRKTLDPILYKTSS